MACDVATPEETTVRALEETGTLVLDDGRRVRLGGVLLPRKPLALQHIKTWRAEASAKKKLASLIKNHRIRLRLDDATRDRYGRYRAHIFTVSNGNLSWIQEELVLAGLARVHAEPGDAACIGHLLQREQQARVARHGIWSDPFYKIMQASAVGPLMKRRHSFQIVEGKVEDVAVVKRQVYLNFGRDWRNDFTAALPKPGSEKRRDRDSLALENLKALRGRKVRVRGWIERRNGPLVRLTHPEDIELIEESPVPPSSGNSSP